MDGSLGGADASLDVEAGGWFFANSLDLFVIMQGGAIVRVNPAFTRATGWSNDEVVGKTLADVVPAEDMDLVAQGAAGLRATGHAACEHRLLRRDGSHIWSRGQATLLASGAVLCVMQDVTEEHFRQIEDERVNRSIDLLRQAAGVSVWRYRPDGDVFTMGFDLGDVDEDGRGGVRIARNDVHREDGAAMREAWTHTLATGDFRVLEYRSRDGEGWKRLRTAWQGARKMPSGRWEVLGITHDVTELADARDAARKGEEAARHAAETKAQFLANMSHEIRTPMNGVLGVLHLLKNEKLTDEGRKLLKEAQACGGMLAELLNDIIDFSKIEEGKLELSPEPIDLVAALDGVAGLLRGQAEDKGLYLRTVIDPSVAWAQMDPVRLRQMLFNLMGNAVKFTLTGGVEVRMAMRGEGAAQRLRVEIEDTGIGISQAAQARLFERFHQADGSTTREFGGSGLGLAISRKMAELMDGEIGMRSAPGQGSTFWIDVVAPAAEAVATSDEADVRWLDGLHVLVVDDNATNRLIATKMLENLGAEVSTAVNGAQAVAAATAGAYDIIFMDIQMPIMDGVQATRALRALATPVAQTPIIAMTANAMAHQTALYIEAGMNGSVPKPLSPARLMSELARLFGEAEEMDAAA